MEGIRHGVPALWGPWLGPRMADQLTWSRRRSFRPWPSCLIEEKRTGAVVHSNIEISL